jgi:transcriptional regulator
MYIPPYHAENEPATLQGLIDDYPLGSWVTLSAGALTANHIPFVLDRSRGEFGTLRGHVSRANNVWQQLSAEPESLVIFQGPQSYITPSWYPSKQLDGRVVPTWDYAVVHAHGRPRAIEDPRWIAQLLSDLTDRNEAKQPLPWQVADAPADFIAKLARAVVGIEIPLSRLVGRWKLSQDETMPDRLGTVAGLAAAGDANSAALARLVNERTQ